MSIARLIASTKSIIVFDFRSDSGLQYIVFLTGVPSEVQPGNQYYIQGYVEFISNPDNLPFTALDMTVFFSLNVLPQSFIINPDIQGNFVFILQVAESVQPEETGLLQLRDTTTASLLYEATIGVLDYPASLFVSPDKAYYDEISNIEITFAAQPSSSYTITSTPSLFSLLTGILDNQGEGIRYFSAPSSTIPGNYSIIGNFAQNQQKQDTFTVLGEPNLTAPLYGRKYNTVGTTDYLQGSVSLGRPGWTVGFKLIWNGTTYLSTITTTTGSSGQIGSYSISGSWKFPLAASGGTVTQEYTRYSPLPVQVATVTYETEIFLSSHTLTLSPIAPSNIYYARPNGTTLSITSNLTAGFVVTHVITQPSPLTTITNVTTADLRKTDYALTPDTSNIVREGIRNITATAEFHVNATASFTVLYGIYLLDYGFNTQNNITLTVFHKPNTAFSVVVKGVTYNFTSGAAPTGTYNIATSNLPVGSNSAVFTQANGATYTGSIIYYPLSSTSVFNPLYTNNPGTQNLVFLLSPKLPYSVTVSPFNLTYTGLSGSSGVNSIGLNPPWTVSGNYTITLTSPYDDPVVITGNHKGALNINSLSKTQGEGETTTTGRAAENETITYQINSFLPIQTFNTDGNGFFTVTIPAVPLSVFAPSSYGITAVQSNPTVTRGASLSILRAVVVSLSITNTPSTLPSNHLFNQSQYQITGATPNLVPFTLAATGQANGAISNVVQAQNQYTALLTTGLKIGSLTLTITALYQPPFSRGYIVVALITLTSTDTEVYNTDSAFSITANHVSNVLTYIRVKYRSSAGTIYRTETFSGVTNSNGDYILSFNPNKINQPGTLLIESYSSASFTYVVSITLNAYYQDINPTPPPLPVLDTSQTTVSTEMLFGLLTNTSYGEPYNATNNNSVYYNSLNDWALDTTSNATAVTFIENTDPATRNFISFRRQGTYDGDATYGSINSLEHTLKVFISFSATNVNVNFASLGGSGFGHYALGFATGNKLRLQTGNNFLNNATLESTPLQLNKIYCLHFIIRRNDTGIVKNSCEWYLDTVYQGKLYFQVGAPLDTTNPGQTYIGFNMFSSTAQAYLYNATFWKRALTTTEIASQKNAAGVYYPHRQVRPEDVFCQNLGISVFNYSRSTEVYGYLTDHLRLHTHTTTVPSAQTFDLPSIYPTKISNYLRFNNGQSINRSESASYPALALCFRTSFMNSNVRVLAEGYSNSKDYSWQIAFTGADRLSFMMSRPANGGLPPETEPVYAHDIPFAATLINQWVYLFIDLTNVNAGTQSNSHPRTPTSIYLNENLITPTVRVIPRTSDTQAGDYYIANTLRTRIGSTVKKIPPYTANDYTQFGEFDLFCFIPYRLTGSSNTYNNPSTQTGTTTYLDNYVKIFAWDCMMAGRPELFRKLFPNHPRSFQDTQYI